MILEGRMKRKNSSIDQHREGAPKRLHPVSQLVNEAISEGCQRILCITRHQLSHSLVLHWLLRHPSDVCRQVKGPPPHTSPSRMRCRKHHHHTLPYRRRCYISEISYSVPRSSTSTAKANIPILQSKHEISGVRQPWRRQTQTDRATSAPPACPQPQILKTLDDALQIRHQTKIGGSHRKASEVAGAEPAAAVGAVEPVVNTPGALFDRRRRINTCHQFARPAVQASANICHC